MSIPVLWAADGILHRKRANGSAGDVEGEDGLRMRSELHEAGVSGLITTGDAGLDLRALAVDGLLASKDQQCLRRGIIIDDEGVTVDV